MKTVLEIYGFAKTANVVRSGAKGVLDLIGKRFTRPIIDSSVDFGSRAAKKFMEGGLGDKLGIGFGALTAAYTGTKALDAGTSLISKGTKTSRLLPQEGILYDLGNPFHGQGFNFRSRANTTIRNANLQPSYSRRPTTPNSIRG